MVAADARGCGLTSARSPSFVWDDGYEDENGQEQWVLEEFGP